MPKNEESLYSGNDLKSVTTLQSRTLPFVLAGPAARDKRVGGQHP